VLDGDRPSSPTWKEIQQPLSPTVWPTALALSSISAAAEHLFVVMVGNV